MKAIFMGTPQFAIASLEALYESKFDIKLVITQPDRPKGRGKKLQSPPVKEKAIELNLDVFQPESIKDKNAIDIIRDINPDIIVVVAFGQILPKEVLEIPRFGCINVHASLLPMYRGAAPINFAIINGEKKSGITTMFMDEGLDTGDMILKDEVEILETDTFLDLHDKLSSLGKKTLSKTLSLIIEEKAPREKQNNEESSYAPIMKKSLGLIDWSKSSREIVNLVRGTYPWPSAFTYYNNLVMKVLRAEYDEEASLTAPGTILSVDNEGIKVAAGEGTVIIKEIQMPGKKQMMVSEYIKGNEIKEHMVLENE